MAAEARPHRHLHRQAAEQGGIGVGLDRRQIRPHRRGTVEEQRTRLRHRVSRQIGQSAFVAGQMLRPRRDAWRSDRPAADRVLREGRFQRRQDRRDLVPPIASAAQACAVCGCALRRALGRSPWQCRRAPDRAAVRAGASDPVARAWRGNAAASWPRRAKGCLSSASNGTGAKPALGRFRQQTQKCCRPRYGPRAGRRNRRSRCASAPVRRPRGAPDCGPASPARRCGLSVSRVSRSASAMASASSRGIGGRRPRRHAIEALRRFRRRHVRPARARHRWWARAARSRAAAFRAPDWARRHASRCTVVARRADGFAAIASGRIADGRDRARASFSRPAPGPAPAAPRAPCGKRAITRSRFGGGGNGAGRTGGDHQAGRRIGLQPLRQRCQAPDCAAPPDRSRLPPPAVRAIDRGSESESGVTSCPMLRQRQRRQFFQPGKIGALALDIVHDAGQAFRQRGGLGEVSAFSSRSARAPIAGSARPAAIAAGWARWRAASPALRLTVSNRNSSSSLSPRARNCGSSAAPPSTRAKASPKLRAARRVGR